MTTPIWITGFEYGLVTPSVNGAGLIDVITGTELSIQNVTKNSGNYALRVNPAGATATYLRKNISSSSILVGRFYVNFASWPSSDTYIFWIYIDGGSDPYIGIETEANGHRLFSFFGGIAHSHSAALSLNTWYRVDFKIDLSNNPRTIDVQVNGDALAQVTKAVAATSFTQIRIGNYGTAFDTYFDDLIFSTTPEDYPIGAGATIGLRPSVDGTHNAGTNVIEDNDGNDIGTVTAYDHLDRNPWSSSAGTYIKQSAVGTGNYAEVNFADTSQTTIKGAMALLQYHASGANADEGGCIIIDEDTTETTVWGNPTTRADYSETSMFYKSVILPTPAGGWDQGAVNALKCRIGYSNDVTDIPYWDSVMLEVAYVPSVASGTYFAKVGSFNIDPTKVVGEIQPIVDIGFQPKVVLFWWGGGHSTGEEVAGGDIDFGFGAATSSSSRFNCTAWSRDNLDTSDTGYGEYVQYVISIYKDGAVDGHFDFSSMDVDGFTLIVDDQFTADYRISYLALGGDDLTNVYIGNYAMPAAEGNFDITDIGFQPDCLLTAFTMSDFAEAVGTNARLSLGMATSSSNQGEVAVFSLDNAATSSTDAYGYNGEIAGYAPVSDVYERTAFVSFLANGVRLHMADDFIGSYYICYIALKGGQYSVGDITTRTDGNDIVETVGFQPSAILFESVNRALNTQDVPTSNNSFSIGAATSTSNRAVQAIWDESGLGTTETAFANYDSAVYANVADDAIVGLMDLKSIDSSGFTCVMDDTDPSECWVTYLAFGPVGGITKSLTDAGISIDIISNLLASLSVYDTATIIEGISIVVAGGIVGTTCWGHITGVLETNVRTFAGNWTGTGSIEGSGDNENLVLDTGQYMVSEVVETGIQNVELLQNNYASGDTVTLQYRHGATQVACEAADWNDYTVPFISLGYVQVRIEV